MHEQDWAIGSGADRVCVCVCVFDFFSAAVGIMLGTPFSPSATAAAATHSNSLPHWQHSLMQSGCSAVKFTDCRHRHRHRHRYRGWLLLSLLPMKWKM